MQKPLLVFLLPLLLSCGLSAQYRISFHQGQAYIALDTLSDSLLAYNVGGTIRTTRPHPDYPRCSRDVFVRRNYITGGKWGLMTPEGKVLTPAVYDRIMEFYGQLLVHCGGQWKRDNNYYYDAEGGRYGALSYTGEVILDTLYDEIKPLGYDALVYRKGKKQGLIHKQGLYNYPPAVRELSCLNLKPTNDYEKDLQYYLVLKGKKGFLLDRGGNEIPTQLGKYTLDQPFRYNRSHVHRAQFRKKDKVGLVDLYGKVILPAEYDRIDELHSYPWWQVQKDGATGVVDSTGKLLFPMDPNTQWITYLGGKYFHYYETGPQQLYGLKDFQGNVVVPPTYRSIFPFGEALLMVEKEGRFGFLDANGKLVIPPVCQKVEAARSAEGLQGAWLLQDSGYRLIDAEGNYRNTEVYDAVQFFKYNQGVALVKKGEHWDAMTADGTLLYDFIFDSVEKTGDFQKVSMGEEYGLMNFKGTLIQWVGENDPRK